MYIYQLKDWPNFTWDASRITTLLAEVRHLQGRLVGKMTSLGFKSQNEAVLSTLTEDAINTSEIEGERLDKEQVRSSVAKRMGMDVGTTHKANRHVDGLVGILIDATKNYQDSLTEQRLFDWHSSLFPSGGKGVGCWRKGDSGAMQVISGAYGKESIHFEAPGDDKVPSEMKMFVKWFNLDDGIDLVLKSAIAHLWFVTIHPFEDGNGRIGRALADMLLAGSEKSTQRFYSMSAQILKERKQYYLQLEQSQKGTLDITAWIEWFLECLKRAIEASDVLLRSILKKAEFWRRYANVSFNVRQKKVLNLMLDHFEGKLTSSKWAKLCKCSQVTAIRDIDELLKRKILRKGALSGRSTHYVFR